jgi:hypothetical protein
MKKVEIDSKPPLNEGELTLKASIALILAKSISVIDKRKHSPDEFLSDAENLIELLGEDEAKAFTLRHETEPITFRFTSIPDSISGLMQKTIVKPVVDDTPWYEKFLDKGRNKNTWKYQNNAKKLFQKRTRKK